MSEYHGGHILRIKVKNFMTYDELELFPKHGLNLIIGLNGSGKSSIMCAICLGLAGKPQYTGRSDQLSDFIKYGHDKATIEIELDDPNSEESNVVITRIIEGIKSTWLLNSSVVSYHEVQNTVKKFNIDVGNICQFLPQEKVTEFSKMNKKQRLENLLQSLGEPSLYNLFKELKQMKEDSLKIEEDINSHQSYKEAESQMNARIRPDVDKHEEKLRMEQNLISYKEHNLKLEYQELREEIIQLKNERNPLREEEDRLKAIQAKIRDDLNERLKIASDISQEMRELRIKLNDFQNAITRKANELEALHVQADNAKIHYQNRIEEKRNQKAKLKELEKQVKVVQELHRKDFELKPKIEARNSVVAMDLEKIRIDMNELSSSLDYANIEKNELEYSMKEILSEIDKKTNDESKKLELLRQRFKDVHQAVIWLQENKHMFKAPVYLPMLLLLKIAKDEDRKFVENVVKEKDLVAFLCEDKEDNKLLTHILRFEKNLQVNIVTAPDSPIECYQSPSLSPELRQLGIKCFLKDIVDAPDAILRFLCHCCNIHMIPLCISSAENYLDDILEKFRLFLTPDAKFQGKISKYSKNRSIRRDYIKAYDLLPSSKDHSDQLHLLQTKYQNEEEKMSTLNDKIQKIQEEMKELEKKENTLREEKRKLQEKLLDIDKTERLYKLKVQSYERKKSELMDEEAEKSKLTQLIQQVNNAKINKCAEISNYLQEFIPLKSKVLECNLKARLVDKSVKTLEKLMEEKTDEYETIHKRCVELTEKMKELRAKGLAMHPEIQKFISVDKTMTPEQQMMYNSLSGMSKDEILMSIRNTEAKLELYSEENVAVIAEYQDRKLRIESIEREIDKHKNKLKLLQVKIEEKKKDWFPALLEHIKNINSRFGRYYQQLNCTGEITLDDCNETDDFPNYGLQITLKYRDNEPLMELSNTHHSGGECSVAAIIFILSLQELTQVPFRCIDEINQGMDSQNERNIYNLIANSAKEGSCSQYFLLTPKLLMDLEMIENRDVAVHILFNSLFLDVKLDIRKHVELEGRN